MQSSFCSHCQTCVVLCHWKCKICSLCMCVSTNSLAERIMYDDDCISQKAWNCKLKGLFTVYVHQEYIPGRNSKFFHDQEHIIENTLCCIQMVSSVGFGEFQHFSGGCEETPKHRGVNHLSSFTLSQHGSSLDKEA